MASQGKWYRSVAFLRVNLSAWIFRPNGESIIECWSLATLLTTSSVWVEWWQLLLLALEAEIDFPTLGGCLWIWFWSRDNKRSSSPEWDYQGTPVVDQWTTKKSP